MHAAGEDARLGRRPVPGGTADPTDIHVTPHDLQQPPAGLVAAGDTHGHRSTAERRHVARRVPGSAGNDLGRVVVENEDRRLARDARQLAIDEFVDDEIAEDGDACLVERVDQGQETSGVNHVGHAGERALGAASGHGCRRIHETAAIRLSVTAAAPWSDRSAWPP